MKKRNVIGFLSFLVFFVALLGSLFAQVERHKTAFYTVRTGAATASDTSFAVASTTTVTSKTYTGYEFISYGVTVTSSGTVDIVVSLQYQWQNEHGNVTAFLTIDSVTLTATGLASFIPSNALPNAPCQWRLSITGQGSNDASTACRVYFAGDNPNKVR